MNRLISYFSLCTILLFLPVSLCGQDEKITDSIKLASRYYDLGLSLDSLAKSQGYGVQYAEILNRIARLLEQKGEKVIAMEYFEAAIKQFRKYADIDNNSLIITLCNAADCAYSLGELGRAIAWGEQARNLQNSTDGFINFDAWRILLDAYGRVGNKKAYQSVYEEYRELSHNGILDLNFAGLEIKRMYDVGAIEEAIEYLDTLYGFYGDPELLKKQGYNIERYISTRKKVLFDRCATEWQTPDYHESMYLFTQEILAENESEDLILKSLYDKYSSNYQYLAESYKAAYYGGDYEYCQFVADRVADLFKGQIKAVLGMSSSEKKNYWRGMTYLKNQMRFMFSDNLPIEKQLFDISLIYKNFLTNSDVVFLKTLEQSGDANIKAKCKELRSTREILNSDSHVFDVDSLEIREIEINREIMLMLDNLSDFSVQDNICCDSISRALRPNEVIIEIADYDQFLYKEYVAMVLRKDWTQPILIELGKEPDFTKYSKMPAKRLYDPSLPLSSELYNLIWKPLLQYINKSDVVYISPSGVLNTMALEALSNAEGVMVSDLYKIKRVSSASSIYDIRNDDASYDSSSVFGGVIYDSNINSDYASTSATWDSGYLIDRSVDETIPYLEGTKREAEMISRIMAGRKGNVSLYIGTDANEYEFKSLSGKEAEIIHIATHGFYIPSGHQSSYKYFDENHDGLAMERSGLMLAGSNDAWNGILTPGIEDGILTASEIEELDLSKTKLVVMSACETGLGDVTEDGIEGLQMAFKRAGVQTLVMSLWKVDDKATELLMGEFYRLLKKGDGKEAAFQSAKMKVRSRKAYRSPYYWAGFIMLD